ncbi:ankyrin repeat-containing domain protein [Tirmania nivea]|nr:ankyrin repeat-containing domain protein [Tirmania nivea]
MPQVFGSGKSAGDGGSKKRPAQSSNPTATPHKSKKHKLQWNSVFQQTRPASPSGSSALQQPPSNASNQSSSILQQATPITGGSDDLWTKAYDKLPEDLKQHLGLNDKLQTLQDLLQTASQAKGAKMAKRLKFKLGDKEFDVQEAADRLFGWITKFKEVGDIAVQYDPAHAALPWAGVRFILLLVVGEQEKFAAAIIGMERVAMLIGCSTIYEQLYLTSHVPENAKEATEILRKGLLALYVAILQALCRLIRIFQGKWIDKLKTPESALEEIRAIDDPESAVNSAVIGVENCYNAATREYSKEKFHKLQVLLEDFMPVMSRINRNVEEEKRIKILRWYSTIPYQSHHDHACEGRVEHTGTWLFKRKEFVGWEKSRAPAILWLHGIPGAGKTKLVSVTIEYLKGRVQFDKVAFFYCKRDEADRRDREKIVLSLIKQLACPPISTQIGGRTRICAEALAAYNKEQNDPSSRHQLNFDSSLQLLGQLVECFEHPAVVLDALDECSEEQELGLAIQDKRLLRGNVSQELRKYIEEVILRDANGMFLWVDWQLRDLCKYIREPDIRAHLGRLPKGLTGVYDEIINTIKSQHDCNFELATRALKWMLVSEYPLKPEELIAAVELNPSILKHSSTSLQESTLAVELLIQSCQGLLLLDTTLCVVRFAHLSVQEYLEIRNEVWGVSITDAQLFVSESCLWTLQYSSFEFPLYEYASRNWFLHCRSYQDLVLSMANYKDTKYMMNIPLLDSFLGSFEDASASYVQWVELVGNSIGDYESLSFTPPYPAFFAAFAGLGPLISWVWDSKKNNMKIDNDDYASLLEIASQHGTEWIVAQMLKGDFENDEIQDAFYCASQSGNRNITELLLDRGANVNLLNRFSDDTALWAAVTEGSLEIITFLLDRGADVNVNGHSGTALCAAAYEGSLEIVTLLLERGADVNLTGGDYGTALGAAAYEGSLEIVTLLLDRGADVNLTGGDYGTALGAAAYQRRLEIVTLLLDRGADVNLTGGYHGTALGAAAIRGSLEIVTLLLDRGADVNLTGGEYGTALGAAANGGRLEIVTLLLDRGADVNLTGGDYGTALGAAAYMGRLEIVTLLLDRGADVNLTGGDYGTALGAAANGGRLEIVTLLLDRGADVNLTGGHYGTALGAAAYEGILEIVTLLLDRGADVNLTGGDYGTALGAAAIRGSLEIVTLLLDRGADVNLTGGDYGTALGATAYEGRLEIVTLLLERGADVNLTGGDYGTALGAAAYEGSLEIVTLLLERGADVNLTGGDYGTALGAAACRAWLEIVTLLLDLGADVNLTGGDYGTALGAAANGRRLDIVTLLLDRGADVNLTGGHYGTALGAAANGCRLDIVTLLLDRGADINLTGGHYGTALGAAANGRRLDIVTLLLNRGADVNLTGGNYGTALGAAANGRRLDIVTLLLDRGADVNLTGGHYGTALGAAANGRRLDIVTLLLNRGADVNLTGGHYGTALGAAANGSRLDIVTLLLDRGADVNLTGGHYGTALGAAANGSRLDIVTLLLNRGADVNLTGGNYGTALGAATYEGRLEIVTLLLDRGADVNLTGGDYGTALGAAAYEGRLEVVTLLLDRGADVNLTGGDYGTALGAAAYKGRLEVVTLLLDRGADVNLTGGHYGTALGAAASGSELQIAKLLLARGANPDLTNSEGARPRDLAEQKGYQSIVGLLDSRWGRKARLNYVHCRTGKGNLQSWRAKLDDTVDPTCRTCGRHVETGRHVALVCPRGEEIGRRWSNWEEMDERKKWAKKVKDGGGEYVVDLVETFFSNLDLT